MRTAGRLTGNCPSIGPKKLQLTGEIASGWLAIFYSPEHAPESLALIRQGREKAGKTMDGFDVVPTVPLVRGPELEDRDHPALQVLPAQEAGLHRVIQEAGRHDL